MGLDSIEEHLQFHKQPLVGVLLFSLIFNVVMLHLIIWQLFLALSQNRAEFLLCPVSARTIYNFKILLF